MDESIANAVLKVLGEVGPQRAMRLDPLVTYANAHLASYAGRDAIQGCLNQLEVKGFVRKEASPINQHVFSYSITAAGNGVAMTLP